jgi:hypothetical protein
MVLTGKEEVDGLEGQLAAEQHESEEGNHLKGEETHNPGFLQLGWIWAGSGRLLFGWQGWQRRSQQWAADVQH